MRVDAAFVVVPMPFLVMVMPAGRFRYFSIMVNHHIGDSDEALKIIDRIVTLAATPGAPLRDEGIDLVFGTK